jgi:arylsulfatase A-like enzyme
MARRLAERGVRYIQCYHGAGQPWDNHSGLIPRIKDLARDSDQPIAALLQDLDERGMLEDTLVVWGGEMGRTSTIQKTGQSDPEKWGRDHHVDGFTVWMAGGGVKGGMTYGETDDFALSVASNPVHVHDLHATMLHLLGFDHEKLTYRYSGRDFRLTDVHGSVVKEILA